MSLLNRVNRVLNNHYVPSSGSRWQLGLLALLVPLLMVFSSPKPVSHAEEENPTVAQEQTPSRHHSAGASQELHIAEAPAVDVAQIPTESNKVRLPAYVVEPPDILLIDTVRLVPKKTCELAPSDVLHIVGPSGKDPFARRIAGDYTITSKGTIDLRSPYGSITVAGLSVIEAQHEIDKRLATMGKNITVSVSLAEVGDRL
jgi:hypothetical protein